MRTVTVRGTYNSLVIFCEADVDFAERIHKFNRDGHSRRECQRIIRVITLFSVFLRSSPTTTTYGCRLGT